jgi:hypothetical protein
MRPRWSLKRCWSRRSGISPGPTIICCAKSSTKVCAKISQRRRFAARHRTRSASPKEGPIPLEKNSLVEGQPRRDILLSDTAHSSVAFPQMAIYPGSAPRRFMLRRFATLYLGVGVEVTWQWATIGWLSRDALP